MMPQEEVGKASQQEMGEEYGRYEGNSSASARRHYETSYEPVLREGSSGKVYPVIRDNANVLRFTLALIALGLLLLFGLLFIFVIGGTTGWASLAVVCFAIIVIAGVGIDKIH